MIGEMLELVEASVGGGNDEEKDVIVEDLLWLVETSVKEEECELKVTEGDIDWLVEMLVEE